jgi:hypothetical protein
VVGAALSVFAGVGTGVVAVAFVVFALAVGAGLLPVVFDDSVTQPAPARRMRTAPTALIDRRVSFIVPTPSYLRFKVEQQYRL